LTEKTPKWTEQTDVENIEKN